MIVHTHLFHGHCVFVQNMTDESFLSQVASQMDGKHYEAGQFAHTLRKWLFREHLGLLSDTERSVADPISDEMIVSKDTAFPTVDPLYI